MSVQNLTSPNSIDIYCDSLTCNTVTGATSSVSSLTITTLPATNNANTNILSRNTTTGNVELNTNVIFTDVTQTLTNKTFLTSANTFNANNGLTVTGGFLVAPTLVLSTPPANANPLTLDMLMYDSSTGLTQKRNDGVYLNVAQTLANKTLNGLTSTGISESRLSGRVVCNYATSVLTVGAVPNNVAIIDVPLNSSIMLECYFMAYCTLGGDINKVRFFNVVYGAKNIAGVVTSFTVSTNIAGDGAYAPSFAITNSAPSVIIVATGVAGDTISYSGSYTISYK